MRSYLFILFFSVCFLKVQSQANSTNKTLETAVMQFNQANKNIDYQELYLQFEQLYAVNKTNWLIPYYAGMTRSIMCLLKMGDKDALANDALLWIGRAKSIMANDEVYCAESLAYTIKMQVNPALRWFNYKDRIYGSLQKAKTINPNNPRIYVLEASLQYHLPKLLGGGCKKALVIAKQAEKLLNVEVGKRKYLPSWGFTSIKEIVTNCRF